MGGKYNSSTVLLVNGCIYRLFHYFDQSVYMKHLEFTVAKIALKINPIRNGMERGITSPRTLTYRDRSRKINYTWQ